MNPQQRGKLRSARVHCPSHPTSSWITCLSSVLEHFVFCFHKILLQIEAEEGSKWEHLQGEMKCQKGNATSTWATVFLTRLSLKGVQRVYPGYIMQFHPLHLSCLALPTHLWASGILPAQSSSWRMYFLLEFPQRNTSMREHTDSPRSSKRSSSTLLYHAKILIQKGPGGNPMAICLLVFPKAPTTQDKHNVC